MSTPNRLLGILLVAVLALVLAVGIASTSFAAPADPTLDLAALKAKLDASGDGTVPGYFKTVDRGSTIETIPVTIMAITGASSAKSALIMFEASGPQIDKFGGIVAGMSGSPVYVDDGGTDKVVGAVSYGDYFTKGGTGLATPIGAMQLVQSTYLPDFVKLNQPLLTTDGLVKSIIISPNPEDFSVQAKQGAFVASPLSSVFIGGLDPSSPGYKLLSKVLAARGQSVVQLSSRLSGTPEVSDQSFETTLVPGAAVAALETRGDMWIGGVGTVTYTDTDTVLAFGHPAFWAGPTSLYMSNAWIDGVWPSSYEPYKVARPTAVRGTITQDRSAGILGTVGQLPAETSFTAHAVNADSGASTTSTVYMSRQLLDAGKPDPWYVAGIDPITAALGVYVAGQDLLDAQQTPGSAEITTTVTATDGTTTYTVSIPNRVDSGYDIGLAVVQDAATAINTLQQVPTDGVHTCSLLSVDLDARFTTRRDWAQIVGVALPKGLQVGANPVKISAREYGKDATQTIDATITVPDGTRLTGTIVAVSEPTLAQNSSWDGGGSLGYSTSFFDPGISINVLNGPSHKSLADAVQGLNSMMANSDIEVVYLPSSPDGGMFSGGDVPFSLASASIVGTVPTDWAFYGAATSSVTKITAAAEPHVVGYGDETMLVGTIVGPSMGATVAVYATPADGAEQYVGTFSTSEGEMDGFDFEAPIGPLFSNTSLRVHYDGTAGNSSADAVVAVRVRARSVVRASARSAKSGRAIKLTARVWPAGTGGAQVVFEFNDHGKHWRAIATKTLAAGASSATASTTWKVAKGKHKVRVRYLGGASSAASTSSFIVITGK